jgi:hypothetical protein
MQVNERKPLARRSLQVGALPRLVAGLAALVAGRVALGLRAVGAQVTRFAAVEALAVQRGAVSRTFLPRLRARCGDVADLATVVARLAAGAGVAAGGHLGHAVAQGVHVATLRAVALQVARLAADVARLRGPSAAAAATAAAAALRAVALQVTDLAADVASLAGLLGRDVVDTVGKQRHFESVWAGSPIDDLALYRADVAWRTLRKRGHPFYWGE